MEMERIPDHVKRYVEGELREYRTLKAELEQLKQDKADIYNRFNQPKWEPVKGSHPGDPTSAAAILLERDTKRMVAIEGRIKRIEAGLRVCTAKEKEIIELKYFSAAEPVDEDVMDFLKMGRQKYYRLKFSALRRIAKVMGVM